MASSKAGPAPEVVYLDLKELAYLVFWGFVLLFSVCFAAAANGGAIPYPRYARFGYTYTPQLYTIQPYHCNMNLYWNWNASMLFQVRGGEPGWDVNASAPLSAPYLGTWNLFVRLGACPTEHLPTTCTPADTNTNYCGEYYTNCMSMYFQRQQEQNDVIPGSQTWTQTYFRTPYDWGDLDRNNAKVGYTSKFIEGSRIWDSLANLAIAATVFQFVAFAVYVFSIYFQLFRVKSRIFAAFLNLFACICWAIVLGLPAKTSQLDEKAWAASFFDSCKVRIDKGPIYHYITFVIVATGTFAVSEVLFMLYSYYYGPSLPFSAVPQQERRKNFI